MTPTSVVGAFSLRPLSDASLSFVVPDDRKLSAEAEIAGSAGWTPPNARIKLVDAT
jgi:hypothetical protein